MNDLATWLDRLTEVAPQRWLLGAGSVAAALVASLSAGASGGGQSAMVTLVVMAFAVGAAVYPGGHGGLGVLVVVAWQWLATADDALSPLAVVTAIGLLVFHVLIALLASTPVGATLDRGVVLRWAQRTAIAGSASVVMWGAVVLMDQRRAAGSVGLTFAAFAVASASIVAMIAALRRGQPSG